MQHVSVDLAKRLKEAGLEWTPKAGDWFLGYEDSIQFVDTERAMLAAILIDPDHLWLPALSGLLEVAKRRRYGVRIDTADSWVELVDPETGGVIVHIDQQESEPIQDALALALLKMMEATG